MIPPLDALPDDPATLKAIILAQRAEAERMAASVRAYEALIQGNCSPGWHFWVARSGLDVSQGMDDSAVSIPPERP